MILLVGAIIAAIIFALLRFGQGPQPATHAPPTADKAPPPAAIMEAPPPPPPAAMAPVAVDRHVLFKNGADAALTGVYYKTPSSGTWGSNQLAAALAPGGSVSLLISDGGSQCWFDVSGHFDDGTEVRNRINACNALNFTFTRPAAAPDAAATQAGVAPPAAPADTHDRHVTIVNGTNVTLLNVYFSATTSHVWGIDQLPGTLAPGASIILNITDGTTECHFDLKSHFSDGSDKFEQINSCEVGRHVVTK
jgi:hypothetical protein